MLRMEESGSDFTPKPYQIDLYQRAVANNTIIYLPTGSGKLYIAVMVIKKFSNQVQLPYSAGGKRILFIVNSEPLVSRKCSYIARHTGLTCRGYSGDRDVGYRNKEDWLVQLNEIQVLVIISAIFNDLLNLGHMTLDKISLIIFDECHKGVGNHPMRSIMQKFEHYKKEEHPRVLGLTATLFYPNIKVWQVEKVVHDLEITFNSKVATMNSATSGKGCGNLKEDFHPFEFPVVSAIEFELISIINYMLAVLTDLKLKGSFEQDLSNNKLWPKSKNDKLKDMIEDARGHIKTTGLYGGAKAILMHMIQLQLIEKYTGDAKTLGAVDFLMTQMTKMRKLISDKMSQTSDSEYVQLKKFSSDQVLKTIAMLQHFNVNTISDQKFCCVIFVRRHTTAQILYHILKNLRKWDENFEFLHPDFMIDYEHNTYMYGRDSLCFSKWNKEALQRFRSGQRNCLVATDIMGEGVDVASCTLIIRYDLPIDFCGYVQSKGRARHKSGFYTMLVSREDRNFYFKYSSYKKVEETLNQEFVGHSDAQEEVKADEIDEKLYKSEITPYIVVSEDDTKTTLTGLSAIRLINRYCKSLMKSKFVNLSPTWKLIKITNGAENYHYKVLLTLPRKSPLKETTDGDVMNSIQLAKGSAALKTCIKLHEMKELSDRLLPVEPSAILNTLDHLFPHWVDEPESEAGLVGTFAKKRHHKIKYPECLHSAFPVTEKPLYLHIIEVKPTYPKPYENRMIVFYDLLNDNAGFGILSTKPMPDLPCFPIFMNVGELNVTIKVNHSKFTLSAKEISRLRLFHWVIFHKVLNVIKDFMVFDKKNLSNSFLVVPTDAIGQINWEVVNKYRSIKEVPSVECPIIRDLDLALVKPNYRFSYTVYVVTRICENVVASSNLPNKDYSFVHYYKERHGIIICDENQPMLEVKAISSEINCIRPRGPKTVLSRRKERANVFKNNQEYFVGELCNRIPFPALYWLKATYLPSVLHRVCQILVAEDLRIQIVNEAKLGVLRLKPGSRWPLLRIKDTDNEEGPPAQSDSSGSTADDSVLPAEPEVDIPGPEYDILGLDSTLYPWKKHEEPANIYRDIERIQLVDIEYFHQFMSTPMNEQEFELTADSRTHTFERFPSYWSALTPPLEIITKDDPNGPSPAVIMQALTSKEAHDVFDLERLKVLGDSFLKFAVSMYLFSTYPQCNKEQLTAIKEKIIGNRNLFYCGSNKQIPGRMKVYNFVPDNDFTAPAFCAFRPLQELLLQNEISPDVLYELHIPKSDQLTGIPSEATRYEMQERVLSWSGSDEETNTQHFLGEQIVPDKSVSDSVKALLAVYLSSVGLTGGFEILKWFGILPANLKVKELLRKSPQSSRIGIGNPDDCFPERNFIERQIGYAFKDRSLLLQAFTHPSYTPNNITPSYERLQLLGNAILDFLITAHIYHSYDHLSPETLMDLRSALVNNITFACLTVKYGLHTAILSYAPELHRIIERFVKFQQDRYYDVNDELLYVLLEEDECMMAEYVDIPNILGEIFESLIGAIYLDSGKDLNKVWTMVYSLIKAKIDRLSKNVPKHPVRLLYETPGVYAQFSKPSIVEGTGSVMVTLEAVIAGMPKIFHGFGANKKQAKCVAAKQALKCLRTKD